jgi:Tol biopolymer transport system component
MRKYLFCLLLVLFSVMPVSLQEDEAGLIAVFTEIDLPTRTTRLLLLNPETREEIVREVSGLVEPTHIFWAKGYNELAISYVTSTGYSLSTYDIEADVVRTYVTGRNVIARNASPDQSQLLYTVGELLRTNDPVPLFTYHQESGESTQLTSGSLHVWNAFWSPDGKTIALDVFDRDLVSGENEFPPSDIYIIDTVTSHVTNVTKTPNMSELSSGWSLDSSQIAYSAGDGPEIHIYVMDKNGRNRRQMSSGNGQAYIPEWILDDTHLVYYWSDHDTRTASVRLVNLETGEEKTLLEKAYIGAFDLSPDRTQIAYTSYETMQSQGKLCVFDILSEEEWCAKTVPRQPDGLVWGR